ncbi:MAG: DUF294 nucleotidyltransferase-like domain-containing protein [Gammaproteobacteria bacterium]
MTKASDGHRLLNTLQGVCLDTETTGLNVASDRIVSIGALRVRGGQVLHEQFYTQLVRPDIPIPTSSTTIHGIDDAMVQASPVIADVLPGLTAFCADCVIIGHNTAFDLAVLRHESERCDVAWKERSWLDTGLLAIALNPELTNATLENLAAWLDIEIQGRHTVAGDTAMTAQIFARLLPKLRDAGVRTLAEAQRFQETAQGALALQRAAGWFDRIDASTAASETVAPTVAALRRIDSFPYCHRLRSFMSSPPLSIARDATVAQAAKMMHAAGVGSLIVGDGDLSADVGIFTERDLLRATATNTTGAMNELVARHASFPVVSLPEDAFVYQALGRMQRMGYRYLGVTDHAGKVSGVISVRSLLQTRTAEAILVGDRIAGAQAAGELAAAADELPSLAEALLDENVRSYDISAVISDVLRHITARAATLAENALVEQGLGHAPVPWALLILGSAGRGESLLAPDQDNAIVYLGSERHDEWFRRLATCIVDILDEAGIPYCKGEVMANNPQWRHTLAGWRTEVEHWVRLDGDDALQRMNAFYDFEVVSGEHRIGEELRTMAVTAAKSHERTIETLARRLSRLRPPIGLFGRFEMEDGRVNMKTAVLPLVTTARLLALLHGSSARTTPDRLREASQNSLLKPAEANSLIEVHELLLRLILRQQLADLRDGVGASNRVDVGRLDAATTKDLRQALRYLDKFISRVYEYCLLN